MARRATRIKQWQRAASHFLLLEAGDSWYGEGQAGRRTKGQVVVEAMNLLGYDAMTLGELEFGLGAEDLKARMEEAQFPLLAANVVSADGQETFAEPYIIREIGTHQVAIIGLITHEADDFIRKDTGGAYYVADPVATARRYISQLSTRCDIIIVLSHLGLDGDQALAQQVPGIDVIVGGHTRRILQPALEVPESGTIILQAGYWGEMVGYAQFHFDASGQVTQYENQVVALTDEVQDDPEMRELLSRYN